MGVITKVTILITPVKVLITLLTKSHDPPSTSLRFKEKPIKIREAPSVRGLTQNRLPFKGVYKGCYKGSTYKGTRI